MSEIDSRPKPEAVQLRSAPFPESGLLPTTLAERRLNLNVQAGDENAEKARRRRRAAEGGPAYSSTSCTKSITLSLFFDGTNNHEPSDREAKPPNTSNIARLFHAAFPTETHGRTRTTPPKPEPCLSLYFRAYQLVPFPLTASKEWIMSDLAAVWRSIQHGLTALALAALLPAQAMGSKPANEMLPAPVEGYNHTSANINRFSVNRAGGHNIAPFNSYGGSQSCCAALPRQWRPGLMATVEWEKDPNPRDPALTSLHPNSEAWGEAYKRHAANYTQHRAVVEIPQYPKSCGVQVHFLPCDQVKVVSSCLTEGHPDYPYKAFYQMKEPKTCPK